MKETRNPAQSIHEALLRTIPTLGDQGSKEDQIGRLSIAILDQLAADGFAVLESQVIFDFEDHLQYWLRQDDDEHRLGTFEPYNAWLDVWRQMPMRRKEP